MAAHRLETHVSDKISGIDQRPGTARTERARTDRAANRDHAHPASAASAPTVEITAKARQLAELERAIAAVPDVDAQRVENARQAIEKGTHRSNPQAIADRLLAQEALFDVKAGSKS
jgi:negative regulator of flagellin synthesis FlgM